MEPGSDPGSARPAGPSRASLSRGPHRRHERQRLDGRVYRRRSSPRGASASASTPHHTSSRRASASSSTASRSAEEAFAEWTTFLKPHIERLDASFFEATTAIAFADLAARGVDIAVRGSGAGRPARQHQRDHAARQRRDQDRARAHRLPGDGPARDRAGEGWHREAGRAVRHRGTRPGGAARAAGGGGAAGSEPRVARGYPGRARRAPWVSKGAHQHANAWVALAALNQLPAPFGPVGECWPESFEHAFVPGPVRCAGPLDLRRGPQPRRDGSARRDAAGRTHRARPLHALVGIRNDKEWRSDARRACPGGRSDDAHRGAVGRPGAALAPRGGRAVVAGAARRSRGSPTSRAPWTSCSRAPRRCW